jgi:hypothetical protein
MAAACIRKYVAETPQPLFGETSWSLGRLRRRRIQHNYDLHARSLALELRCHFVRDNAASAHST